MIELKLDETKIKAYKSLKNVKIPRKNRKNRIFRKRILTPNLLPKMLTFSQQIETKCDMQTKSFNSAYRNGCIVSKWNQCLLWWCSNAKKRSQLIYFFVATIDQRLSNDKQIIHGLILFFFAQKSFQFTTCYWLAWKNIAVKRVTFHTKRIECC